MDIHCDKTLIQPGSRIAEGAAKSHRFDARPATGAEYGLAPRGHVGWIVAPEGRGYNPTKPVNVKKSEHFKGV